MKKDEELWEEETMATDKKEKAEDLVVPETRADPDAAFLTSTDACL